MPEYLAPGVFVEETSFRAKSIDGVGTSTAAFVGMVSRGATTGGNGPNPPLITSFTDFERYYGGLDDLMIDGAPVTNHLAHAARAFFNNGGGRLYVARILGAAAAAARVILNPTADAADQVSLVARSPGGAVIPGSAGTNFHVVVRADALATTKRLALKQPVGTTVRVGTDHYVMGIDPIPTSAADATGFTGLGDDDACAIVSLSVEVYDPTGLVYEASGLGLHARHSRYVGSVMGASPPQLRDALANPVQVELGADVTAFALLAAIPTAGADLVGGSDGSGPPTTTAFQDALNRLLALEDISIVAAPGASSFATIAAAVNLMLIGHAEARRSYRIAVLDTPPALEPGEVVDLKGKIDSKYAALYYPWIRVANPLAGTDPTQPTEMVVPPSGHVCGIYARTDIQRGVWKAPANETVTGALDVDRAISFGEQERLNPLGINCIRALPNRGIRVWGARTISSDPEWKYVNVRRYFLYLESSIDRGTQWAVFEPNGEALWANVRTTVSDFLYNEWVSGALLGTSPKEAFFVRCDRTTMTQNDLDNGRLICLIGVAAIKPAEFVIFRIGQKTADQRG
jgi:phage tail sheath protein FI